MVPIKADLEQFPSEVGQLRTQASASRQDPYRRQPFGDSRLLPGVLLRNFTLSRIVGMH